MRTLSRATPMRCSMSPAISSPGVNAASTCARSDAGFASAGAATATQIATKRIRSIPDAVLLLVLLQHGREEAVGVVQVRVEPQVLLGAGNRDALAFQHLARGHEVEVGVLREELVHDVLVFFGEQAARAVDEAPARLHQRRGRGEDGALLRLELGEPGDILPRLQAGIAP